MTIADCLLDRKLTTLPQFANLGPDNYHQAYRSTIVEYVLYLHGALRATEIPGLLLKECGLVIGQSNVSNYLRDLVNAGRVVKIRRGLYAHPTSAVAQNPGFLAHDNPTPRVAHAKTVQSDDIFS